MATCRKTASAIRSQVPLPARHHPQQESCGSSSRRSRRRRPDPGGDRALLVQLPGRQDRRCIPGRASPSPTTPARNRPISSSTNQGLLVAEERRAGRATPWKWGRWPACWWALPAAAPIIKDVVTDALGRLKVGPEALFSTLGRTAARGLETRLAAHWLHRRIRPADRQSEIRRHGHGRHQLLGSRIPGSPNPKASGFTEAPRGALGHWIQIKDAEDRQLPDRGSQHLERFAAKTAKGQHGAYEAALIGTPMADPKRPVEILRTIHSFDPCLACASHVIGPDGEKLAEIIVR